MKQKEIKLLMKIDKDLQSVSSGLKKQNSFLRGFTMSVIQGVGGIIGATIVAGIVLLILSKFFHTIDQVPFLKVFFQTTKIEKTIDTKIQQSQP
jgi:uncharacterized protein (DUF697 family)